MAAYIISDTTPLDPAAWEEYVKLAPATIKQYGGRYLARGGDIESLEGTWTPKAIVIVEFPDAAAAKAWYNSPEYAKAKVFRDAALQRDLIIVDGTTTDTGTLLMSLVNGTSSKD